MKKWFNNSNWLFEIPYIHRVQFHLGESCMVCYHYRALNVAFHLSYRFQNRLPSFPIQTNFLQLMKLNLGCDYTSVSKTYEILCQILTFTGSSISRSPWTRPVTTKKHLPLSHIRIASSSTCTPTVPSGPISFIWNMGFESVVLFLYFIHLHSQGPVSVEVPVQGLLPLNSIWRCRISASHVPAHAPQLSHVVHAPSTVNDQHFI